MGSGIIFLNSTGGYSTCRRAVLKQNSSPRGQVLLLRLALPEKAVMRAFWARGQQTAVRSQQELIA